MMPDQPRKMGRPGKGEIREPRPRYIPSGRPRGRPKTILKRLESELLSPTQVGSLLGLTRWRVAREIDQGRLPGHRTPDTNICWVHRTPLIRVLLQDRNWQALVALGWVPSVLVVGSGTRLASDTRTHLPEKVQVHYASDLFSAGMMLARHEPFALAVDLSLGHRECVRALAWLKRDRPWVRRVSLGFQGEDILHEEVETLVDWPLIWPFQPQDLAQTVMEGMED